MLKYNKHYIGLAVDGSAFNFVAFAPRKGHVIMTFRLDRSEEVDAVIDEAGLIKLAYDTQFRQYRVRIDAALKEPARVALVSLAKQAKASFGKG